MLFETNGLPRETGHSNVCGRLDGKRKTPDAPYRRLLLKNSRVRCQASFAAASS